MQFVKPKPKFTFGPKNKFTFGKSDKKIKDVEPKDYSGIDYEIERKEDLKKFIDDPCLSACEELFDKKIRTFDSGCSNICPDEAYVCIAYDSLDLKNKILAQKLIADGKAYLKKMTADDLYDDWCPESCLRVSIPTSLNDSVNDVSKKLFNVIAVFKKQDKFIERDEEAYNKRIENYNKYRLQILQSDNNVK